MFLITVYNLPLVLGRLFGDVGHKRRAGGGFYDAEMCDAGATASGDSSAFLVKFSPREFQRTHEVKCIDVRQTRFRGHMYQPSSGGLSFSEHSRVAHRNWNTRAWHIAGVQRDHLSWRPCASPVPTARTGRCYN
jgi:hypothetical protein